MRREEWMARLRTARGEHEDFFRQYDEKDIDLVNYGNSNYGAERIMTDFIRFTGGQSTTVYRDGHRIMRAYVKGRRVVFHFHVSPRNQPVGASEWDDVDNARHLVIRSIDDFFNFFDSL